MTSSLNKTSGCRRSTLETVLFCSLKFAVFCRAGTNTEKNTDSADTLHSQREFVCREHVTYTTSNKGQHSNWSDTLIALLFAAQVQYRLSHYHGHYPVVTNSSICTLYESAITYQSVNCCEIRVTHILSFFLLILSHFLLE